MSAPVTQVIPTVSTCLYLITTDEFSHSYDLISKHSLLKATVFSLDSSRSKLKGNFSALSTQACDMDQEPHI